MNFHLLAAGYRGRVRTLLMSHASRDARRRPRTTPNGQPLLAWMAAVSQGERSRICALLDHGLTTRWPFPTQASGAELLVQRLSQRYHLTWVQANLLMDRVRRSYRAGRTDYALLGHGPVYLGEFPGDAHPAPGSHLVRAFLNEARSLLHSHGVARVFREGPPLSFILDDRLKDLVLLYQLDAVTRSIRAGLPTFYSD